MIELKPFTEADFYLLISWIKTEEALMQFAGVNFSFPLTADQLAANIENKKITAYKAVHQPANKTIGHGEIYITDEGEAILGKIMIGEEALRGNGFGGEIVKQLVHIAFTQLNVKKVLLYVFDWNVSAIKCYQNAGFEIERGNDKKRYINGQTWTAIRMGMNEDDWLKLTNTV